MEAAGVGFVRNKKKATMETAGFCLGEKNERKGEPKSLGSRRTQLARFARNPARGVREEPNLPGSRGTQLAGYALDVNIERVEDVLMHKRLLHLAHDPANRPAIEVHLVQFQSIIGGNLADSNLSDFVSEVVLERPLESSNRKRCESPRDFTNVVNPRPEFVANVQDRFLANPGSWVRLEPGKIAKEEVEAWLEKTDQETAEKVVEDLICKGGCFTYICSSRKLNKRTQSLTEGIFKQGEKYTSTGESLVLDTPSIEYWATAFEEKQERLKHQKEDIEANLKTQCMQLRKIARKEVEEWLEKASQQIGIKVEGLINQGECSSSTNLKKNIEELKQILEEGKEFTNAGVSLVIDDHSIKGVPLLVEECRGKDDIQDQILEWLKGDEVTRIAISGMGGVGKTTIVKQEKVGSDVFSDGKIKRDIEPFVKQISYECLEPQCQQCFLYCALYPEDHEILKEELIEYWIEEGLLYKEGKTREAMNWKGHDILDKLVDNCLLQSVKNIDKQERVSMHDLLREMALEVSQFFVKAGIALEKLPEEDEWRDCLKVSLMRNHIKEILSSMPSLKCLMLTTLLLSNNNISTIPEAFFEHMLGLKILDLSHNLELSRLPSSVSKLEKLTTLLLGNCGFLEESLKCVFDEESLGLSPLVPPTSFFPLKEIEVLHCHQLKKVFSSGWLLRYFQSLETNKVESCLKMEELISSSAHEEEKVTLPQLQSLKLIELHKLKSICSCSSVLICDSI
ncbi:hypothetical protein SLEP1_g53485 [Rubroshorea leprosula]|uniref:NB-ARC domain-containing protein n=1 Tax=Rubroshorea leprosula TaxID=152421 RepID=A0AAV5MCB8_9ROSI|nr:hypothetical protein SLEP1_g53485 [Rubroshorea leprosula]